MQDPLGLGANPERLVWFAEAERVHSRWAMLAVAGILAQVSAPMRNLVMSHNAPAVEVSTYFAALLAGGTLSCACDSAHTMGPVV